MKLGDEGLTKDLLIILRVPKIEIKRGQLNEKKLT
jgi:hypothetical protein